MDGQKRFSAQVAAGDDPGATIVAALRVAEDFAKAARLADPLAARLLVVVEELVSNAAGHGARGGEAELALELSEAAGGVALTLEDSGAPFDPSASRAFQGPDAETGGGVGLELVRTWAAEMSYARENGRNCLRLLLR